VPSVSIVPGFYPFIYCMSTFAISSVLFAWNRASYFDSAKIPDTVQRKSGMTENLTATFLVSLHPENKSC